METTTFQSEIFIQRNLDFLGFSDIVGFWVMEKVLNVIIERDFFLYELKMIVNVIKIIGMYN